jgi:hypothetical protein
MQPNSSGKSGIIDVRRTENRIEKYLLLNMLQITLAHPNIDSILNPSIVKSSLFLTILRRGSPVSTSTPLTSYFSWSQLLCRNPPLTR